MKAERLQQVSPIFQHAVAISPAERPAFLEIACAGDAELRQDVERLIYAHEQAGSFIESPAYERAAGLLTVEPGDSVVGRLIGHYRIVAPLGKGGMGEVYLAHDTKLERSVALKVLPSEVASDQERMRRFTQEARAAAGLNHPHIAHVYEIGETEGTHFIAMEYIDGVTLKEKIHRENTPPGKLLKYLTQVAEGLAKAHAAGIVHRDLKPDNVMITRDDYAKILDFGLAKLVEPQRAAGAQGRNTGEMPTAILAQHSTPGMIMGTAGYMSPEQALGRVREIDHRSDIFSFGCILFEAATGRKAFEGKDALDSVHKIVHAPTPQINDVNPSAPDELQRIVRRCLAKEPDKRYQSIKDVAIELDEVCQELKGASETDSSVPRSQSSGATFFGSHTLTEAQSRSTDGPLQSSSTQTSSAEYIVGEVKRNKKIVFAVLGLIIVAGAAFAIYQYALKPERSAARFERVKLTRITTEGNLQSVAVSPDGKYIAYTLLEAGKLSLWTKHLATDSRVQIVAPTEATIMTPHFFSHDGSYVFYGLHGEQNPQVTLFQVAVLGGPPKKILTHVNSPAGLSPDGRAIAFARYRPGVASDQFQVWLADADGANERRLWACSEPQRLGLNGVSWSPDGKLLTVDYGTEEGGDQMTVATITVADGAFKVITPQRWGRVGRIAWFNDGSGMAVAARERGPNNWQIWRISYPGGEAQRITNDLHSYGFHSLTLTSDSRTLVALQVEGTWGIWIAPEGDARHARALASRGSGGGLDWTPDGRLVFTSNTGSSRTDIWMMNADGGEQKPLTERGNSPQVSPDGRYIFFESQRSKTKQVWRMDSDGSHAKQLTDGSGVETFALTPDGRWVIYSLYAPTILENPGGGRDADQIGRRVGFHFAGLARRQAPRLRRPGRADESPATYSPHDRRPRARQGVRPARDGEEPVPLVARFSRGRLRGHAWRRVEPLAAAARRRPREANHRLHDRHHQLFCVLARRQTARALARQPDARRPND